MKKTWLIAGGLLFVAVLLRAPFYFVDVVDWDESTFILMGQSLLDGHLPYTELWDLKPPLAFVFFGLFIGIGKSIIGVRIAGTICVWLTSFGVYLVGKYLGNNWVGCYAGVLAIVTVTIISGGQATMTEHVALVPLMAALALFVTQTQTSKVLFGAGFLLTCATLIRLNLAYVVVAVGLWLVFSSIKSKQITWGGIFAYCLGSLSLIFASYLPYLIKGLGSVWLDSVVLAPLSYSQAGGDWREPLGAGLLCFLFSRIWRQASSQKQQEFDLVQVFLLGTFISISQGGAFFQHYYIQIFPLLALTLTLLISKLPWKLGQKILLSILALMLVLELVPIKAQYQLVGERWQAGQSLNYGVGYATAQYINSQEPPIQSAYLMNDQIAYWLADLKPPRPTVTHPSNLTKEHLLAHIPGAGTSAVDELKQILAQKPQLIIKHPTVFYLEDYPDAQALLSKTLAQEYEPRAVVGDRQVYWLRSARGNQKT